MTDTTIDVELAVLGCGWAGVSTAYHLLKSYPSLDIVCIESSNRLGGLLKTEIYEGFTFDVGGSHVIFSRNDDVLQSILSLLGDNIVEHRRKSYVYLNGAYIPYPFENGIYVLPSEKRAEILISFIEALVMNCRNPDWRPKNLHEWIHGFLVRRLQNCT